MKKLWLFAAMLMSGIQLIFAGDDLKYPVSQVADSLKANAKVVIRDWDQTYEIKSVRKGILTVSYVYSILNENGIEKAVLIVPYSQKLHKVHSIRGAIYDAGG